MHVWSQFTPLLYKCTTLYAMRVGYIDITSSPAGVMDANTLVPSLCQAALHSAPITSPLLCECVPDFRCIQSANSD